MERAVKERLIGAVVVVTVAWLLIPVFLDPGEEPAQTTTRKLALPDAPTTGEPPVRRETIVLSPEAATSQTTQAGEAPITLPVPSETRPQESPRPLPQTPGADDTASSRAAVADASASVPPDSQPAAAEQDTGAGAGSDQATVTERQRAADAVAVASEVPPAAEPDAVATALEPPADATGADRASSSGLWAVQVGSFGNADNAQRLAAQLREGGLPAFISEVTSGGRTMHRVRIGPQASRAAAEAVVAQLQADGQQARSVPHP